MDITGKIIYMSEERSGVSKSTGSPWKAQDFVIETHDQYPRRCVFSVFGEDRLRQFDLKLNGEYTVSFDIDAHEYNGRWFNNIRAWRVVPATAGAAAPQGAAPAAPQAPTSAPAAPAASGPVNSDPLGADDDLPF